MADYQQKYFKYKQKYLDLLKNKNTYSLIGGAEEGNLKDKIILSRIGGVMVIQDGITQSSTIKDIKKH